MTSPKNACASWGPVRPDAIADGLWYTMFVARGEATLGTRLSTTAKSRQLLWVWGTNSGSLTFQYQNGHLECMFGDWKLNSLRGWN